jgi:hypothetical protein
MSLEQNHGILWNTLQFVRTRSVKPPLPVSRGGLHSEADYSTVTLLARLWGWSISQPRTRAT